MTKFDVVREFDKFTPKSPPKLFKLTSLWMVGSLSFQRPYPLKFRNSLFLDRCGLNLVQGTNSEATSISELAIFFDFPSEKAT